MGAPTPLIDGLGTYRVKSVTSDNASIPSGAEVIDLSRYTGIPGLTAATVTSVPERGIRGNRLVVIDSYLSS